MIKHFCVSVRGILNMTKAEKRKIATSITIDKKTLRTADEVQEHFLNELSQGHEVLPVGECDNFDYKTVCKGHEERE